MLWPSCQYELRSRLRRRPSGLRTQHAQARGADRAGITPRAALGARRTQRSYKCCESDTPLMTTLLNLVGYNFDEKTPCTTTYGSNPGRYRVFPDRVFRGDASFALTIRAVLADLPAFAGRAVTGASSSASSSPAPSRLRP